MLIISNGARYNDMVLKSRVIFRAFEIKETRCTAFDLLCRVRLGNMKAKQTRGEQDSKIIRVITERRKKVNGYEKAVDFVFIFMAGH